jgi:hypothetical protein
MRRGGCPIHELIFYAVNVREPMQRHVHEPGLLYQMSHIVECYGGVEERQSNSNVAKP